MLDEAKKVLLIQDDKNITELIKTAFSNEGFKVEVAADGEKGFQAALKDHPDLILLDIMMPGMDGLTMMKSLRADSWGKDATIILLTNLAASDAILQEVVNYQPAFYITKSEFELTDMVAKAKEVLGVF